MDYTEYLIYNKATDRMWLHSDKQLQFADMIRYK